MLRPKSEQKISDFGQHEKVWLSAHAEIRTFRFWTSDVLNFRHVTETMKTINLGSGPFLGVRIGNYCLYSKCLKSQLVEWISDA